MMSAAYNAAAEMDTRWVAEHFQENYALLHTIGRLFLGSAPDRLDMVDDAIQDVFIRLWNKREQLRGHPNLDAWLVEALRRQLRGQMSRIGRRARLAPQAPEEAADAVPARAVRQNPSDVLEGKERLEMLCQVLGRDNARLFYEYCVERYTAKELADRHGITVDCVWARISRAKKTILKHADVFFMLMLAFVLRA